MLALETMKDSLGCNEMSCLAEIGARRRLPHRRLRGARRRHVRAQLQLLNIKTARAEQRVSREYKGGPQGLLDEMRLAAKLVVRDLLAARSGTLALSVTEEGATVRVDGSIVGTTPLKPISLAGGPHTFIVEREQFVRHSQDINIDENQETKVKVSLLPSEEYKNTYRSKARATRISAWGLTVGGAALLVAGGVMLGVNQAAAKSLANDSRTYNSAAERQQGDYNALQARQGRINAIDGLSLAAGIVGVAAAAVGIVLFVTGDSPSKYDNAELDSK